MAVRLVPGTLACAAAMDLWAVSVEDVAARRPGLADAGWTLRAFADGEALLAALDEGHPDALLLGHAPPWGATGLVSRVRAGERWVDLPVLVVGSAGADTVTLLNLGADDVVPGTVSTDELVARLRRRTALKRRTDALRTEGGAAERRTVVDALTELHNRRYFHLRLDDEFRRAQRYDNPLSLVLVDLDAFAGINAAAGHLVGDEVLRAVARGVLGCVRETDTVARSGGDEFACVLPQTHLAGALTVAERIRREVAAVRGGPTGQLGLTASLGVASFPAARVQTAEELLAAADGCVGRAKREGRNRVCLADPAAGAPPLGAS